MVWNGTSIKGRENVERFMTDLPASKHDPCSLDCQPVLPQGLLPCPCLISGDRCFLSSCLAILRASLYRATLVVVFSGCARAWHTPATL